VDNKDAMMDIDDSHIEDPVLDPFGPKPPVDTEEQLRAQIGDLTAEDLRKFGRRWPDEHYIHECIDGKHGPEIQGSRLLALTKLARGYERLQYPDNLEPDGSKKLFLRGNGQADYNAEYEMGRLLDARLRFHPEEE